MLSKTVKTEQDFRELYLDKLGDHCNFDWMPKDIALCWTGRGRKVYIQISEVPSRKENGWWEVKGVRVIRESGDSYVPFKRGNVRTFYMETIAPWSRPLAPEGSLGECGQCGGDYPVKADHMLSQHDRYASSALAYALSDKPAPTTRCEGSNRSPVNWMLA